MIDVGILGGGPAGCALAHRLCQFGLQVLVVSREPARRHHVGESVPASARPILEAMGLDLQGDPSVVSRSSDHEILWGETPPPRRAPDDSLGPLQVWRGPFDAALRRQAEIAGARFELGAVVGVDPSSGRIEILIDGRRENRRARLIADCTGRTGILGRFDRRPLAAVRTMAITAHWLENAPGPGGSNPPRTFIEALPGGWVWSAPIDGPARMRDVTVFLEPVAGASLVASYDEALACSTLARRVLDGCKRVDAPRGIDASPYGSERYATAKHILVGDAGAFVDPLSGHGVHKALDSAWLAATVLRTILLRPSSTAAAVEFYNQRQREIVDATHRRVGEFYWSEERFLNAGFWRHRRREPRRPPPAPPKPPLRLDMRLVPAPGVVLRDGPVLIDEFIETSPVLSGASPTQERPIRFWQGISLPDIVELVRHRESVGQAARNASIPYERAFRAIEWLYLQRYLQEEDSCERSPGHTL